MDLYVVLGVGHGATESEIKRAYRRLARRFHPDINPGDRTAEIRFREILEAYETLIDPDRRSRYDAGSSAADTSSQPASGFEGFDFSHPGVDQSVTFGDLFADVLTGRASRGPAPDRGADLHQSVQLTFEQAFAGMQHPVTVTRVENCRTCAGGGRVRGSGVKCRTCQGTGTVRSVRGHMVFSRSCPVCGGLGEQRTRLCEWCGGKGQVMRTETMLVDLPAGVADGDRVRVPGAGSSPAGGGEPGDLYVSVQVMPHETFRREGDDILVVVPVAIHEAALGARIEIPAPDGTARLKVPPGTQSGQRFRLRERGAISLRNGHRGDLVAEVRLMLPKLLDERSKALLREFGQINGESVRRFAR
jgi:molecular chaperone DnaJ